MDVNTIGGRIRQLRENKGWSIRELAQRARMSNDGLWRVETDQVEKPYTLARIAEALGVSVAHLREGSDLPLPDKLAQLDALADRLQIPAAAIVAHFQARLAEAEIDESGAVTVTPTATAPARTESSRTPSQEPKSASEKAAPVAGKDRRLARDSAGVEPGRGRPHRKSKRGNSGAK